jgi:N-acetyl-anhydromuramyl-L-alanine amidase AmpD
MEVPPDKPLYSRWLEKLGVPRGTYPEEACREAAMPPDSRNCPGLDGVRAVVVHHSATESGGAGAFRVLHRLVRGWNDVGYHFVIGNGTHTGDGLLERGRPVRCRGAHARGANEFSLGVCLVGDFSTGNPTPRQMSTLGRLLAGLLKEHGLSRAAVMLHRQVEGSRTECPGKNLTLAMVLQSIDRHDIEP